MTLRACLAHAGHRALPRLGRAHRQGILPHEPHGQLAGRCLLPRHDVLAGLGGPTIIPSPSAAFPRLKQGRALKCDLIHRGHAGNTNVGEAAAVTLANQTAWPTQSLQLS